MFMATEPQTIDEYLSGLSPENREALQKVRRAVHAAAPGSGGVRQLWDACIQA
jgi:uncharacterized protein YdhG (YjbR/CyaY superfamily)